MANSASHGSLGAQPIKNARWTVAIVYTDATNTLTDPGTPDTEFSLDGGAFADCAEEVTTISGTNGCGFITLTGAETNGSVLAVAFKVSTGPKSQARTFFPRLLPTLASGTASAGAAGTLTLASSIAYDLTGCFLRTTGGTGGGGTGGANNQARLITGYNTSTQVATVSPNWETTPDNTTTYDILMPEGVTIGTLKTLNPTVAGRTLDVSAGGEAGLDWANVGSPTTSVNLSGTNIGTVSGNASVAIARSTGALLGTDESTGVSVAAATSSGPTASAGSEVDILGNATSRGALSLYLVFTTPATAPTGPIYVDYFDARVTGQSYTPAVRTFVVPTDGMALSATQKILLGTVTPSRYGKATLRNGSSVALSNAAILYQLAKEG